MKNVNLRECVESIRDSRELLEEFYDLCSPAIHLKDQSRRLKIVRYRYALEKRMTYQILDVDWHP